MATLKESLDDTEVMTHQASRLAKDAREFVKDVHYRAEAAYQSPIFNAIFFKRLFPILEQLKDIFGRLELFEIGSERVLREIYSSLFGVIGQGVDDQFDVFSGECSRRHEEMDSSLAP